MNNFFKIIILSLTVNLLLTACSEEQRQELTQKIKEKQIENAVKKLPKHNEPIPEYPTLTPFKLSLDEINKNKKYVHSQIVQNINKTISEVKIIYLKESLKFGNSMILLNIIFIHFLFQFK